MNGMRDKLSRMDDMERQISSMKSKILDTDELGSKYKSLEVKCTSLQNSFEILMKDSIWKYSAPSIPNSYWTELGFDDNNVHHIEDFLRQIKDTTCALRRGEEIDEEGIVLCCESFLPYHKALLPHWKEFTTALQLCQTNDAAFTIQGVQLTTSVMDLLTPAMRGKLEQLFFDNIGFVTIREGIEFSMKCMDSNQQLNTFCWVSNPLVSTENARYLVEAIINHPSIDYVQLENCFGDDIDGYNVVKLLLDSDKSWKTIDLEQNNISTRCGTEIPDFIASNPPLEHLYLEGNKLNDDDATLIASAMNHNTNLQTLRLGDNVITDTGKNIISKAFYDTTSLNSMANCNNTCQTRGIALSIPCWYTNCNDSYQNPKWLRAKKIYGLLSTRNEEGTNVQHLNVEFDDDEDSLTLKLVPKVLDCIYRYYGESGRRLGILLPQSKYIPALSIIYEILGSWKMPELYELRGVMLVAAAD